MPLHIVRNDITAMHVDAVVNDKDLSSIAEDGVTVMKMLDAIYRSAESGHEVRL